MKEEKKSVSSSSMSSQSLDSQKSSEESKLSNSSESSRGAEGPRILINALARQKTAVKSKPSIARSKTFQNNVGASSVNGDEKKEKTLRRHSLRNIKQYKSSSQKGSMHENSDKEPSAAMLMSRNNIPRKETLIIKQSKNMLSHLNLLAKNRFNVSDQKSFSKRYSKSSFSRSIGHKPNLHDHEDAGGASPSIANSFRFNISQPGGLSTNYSDEIINQLKVRNQQILKQLHN